MFAEGEIFGLHIQFANTFREECASFKLLAPIIIFLLKQSMSILKSNSWPQTVHPLAAQKENYFCNQLIHSWFIKTTTATEGKEYYLLSAQDNAQELTTIKWQVLQV